MVIVSQAIVECQQHLFADFMVLKRLSFFRDVLCLIQEELGCDLFFGATYRSEAETTL
jgi:hypothetical protein